MAHYNNDNYVNTPGGSLTQIGKMPEEYLRTRLFESIAQQNDTYHDDVTGKTWRMRNGTLERHHSGVTLERMQGTFTMEPLGPPTLVITQKMEKIEIRERPAELTFPKRHFTNATINELTGTNGVEDGKLRLEIFASNSLPGDTYRDDETGDIFVKSGTVALRLDDGTSERAIQRTAQEILAKVKEMFAGTLKVTPMDTANLIERAKEHRIEQTDGMKAVYGDLPDGTIVLAADVRAGEIVKGKDIRAGTWTRIDTPEYKRQMEEMRNKAWTEGVKGVIELLKVHGHHVAAYQVAQASIDDKRWEKAPTEYPFKEVSILIPVDPEDPMVKDTIEYEQAKEREEIANRTWSRAMEEAARILSNGFNMTNNTRDGFLNVVKTDQRWRDA